jgi:hypothetical protein
MLSILTELSTHRFTPFPYSTTSAVSQGGRRPDDNQTLLTTTTTLEQKEKSFPHPRKPVMMQEQ